MARNNSRNSNQPKEFDEKIIKISRVSKKTKGGNQIGFSALVVVGDRKGKVGVGLGKAGDVLSAIQKGIKKAKQKMIVVPLDGTTIPFAVTVKRGAGKVMLKPASKGTGVIAGGPVRAVVEAAGVRDVVAKILGSENQASSVHATFKALKHIADLVKIKDIKLRSIAQIEKEEQEKMAALQAEAKEKATAPKKTEQKTEQKTKQKADKKTEQKVDQKVEKKTQQKIEAKAKASIKKTAPKKVKKITTTKKTSKSKK